MNDNESSGAAESLARRFHDTYERLAPQFGYATRDDTKVFDPTSPNGRLMIAVCAALAVQPEPAHPAQPEAGNALLNTVSRLMRDVDAYAYDYGMCDEQGEREGKFSAQRTILELALRAALHAAAQPAPVQASTTHSDCSVAVAAELEACIETAQKALIAGGNVSDIMQALTLRAVQARGSK